MESQSTQKTISGQDKDPLQRGITISNIINSDELPLYEQAARQTGFRMSVDAREGEQHTFWYDSKGGQETMHDEPTGVITVTVQEGMLGIQITRPAGQIDHQAFWDIVRKLRVERDQKK